MVDPSEPGQRLLYADYTVLCTAPDGSISSNRHGLYDHDTRIISKRRLTIDGDEPAFVSCAELGPDRRLTILLARREGGSADGPALPQDATEVWIETSVGPGLREGIRLTNRSALDQSPRVGLEIEGDFADVLEVRHGRRQTGETTTTRTDAGVEVVYRAARGDRRLERGVRMVAHDEGEPTNASAASLEWRPTLSPGASWTVDVVFESLVDGRWRGAVDRERNRQAWRDRQVAAEAILWAAEHAPRELVVGAPSAVAILGQKLAPGVMDRYLARAAWEGQMSDGLADPDRPDNLFDPLPGDWGAHGDFDARAREWSPHLWLATRAKLYRATALALGLIAARFATRRVGRRS